jgi:hypothetical protein
MDDHSTIKSVSVRKRTIHSERRYTYLTKLITVKDKPLTARNLDIPSPQNYGKIETLFTKCRKSSSSSRIANV